LPVSSRQQACARYGQGQRRDSNPHQPVSKTGASTTCATSAYTCTASADDRIRTCTLLSLRQARLPFTPHRPVSYPVDADTPVPHPSAGRRPRTSNPCFKRASLCPLSYAGVSIARRHHRINRPRHRSRWEDSHLRPPVPQTGALAPALHLDYLLSGRMRYAPTACCLLPTAYCLRGVLAEGLEPPSCNLKEC